MNKRILFLNCDADWCGAEKVLYQTVCILSRYHKCHVVLPYSGILLEKLKHMHVDCTVLRFSILRRSTLNALGIIKYLSSFAPSIISLIKISKINRIDIIYSNSITILEGLVISMLLRRMHIWHIHSSIQRPRLAHNLLKYCLQISKGTNIFVSFSLLSSYGLTPSNKNVVIYNGIEAKSDLSKNACKSHEKYTIGMVGTFSRVKGQRYLLYAINYLLEAGLLQRPISVRLVGPVYGGDIFWRDHLTEYIKEHRLGTIVSIEDFIEDIESVYNKLDLFVLSSLREGCSLVALEAISAGVPVISFKNGGAEDVLNHDPECLVECRDYRALALTIIDFMTNDKKAKIISRRQYDRFRNNFTHDIYKHNLLNINSLSIQ